MSFYQVTTLLITAILIYSFYVRIQLEVSPV